MKDLGVWAAISLFVGFLLFELRETYEDAAAARAELEDLRARCAPAAPAGDVVKRLQLPSGRVAVMRSAGPGQMSVQFEGSTDPSSASDQRGRGAGGSAPSTSEKAE